MQLPADTLYTAHAENPAGMHALGILERRFGRKVHVLTGEDVSLQPGCVVFVSCQDLRYPNRYLRVLRADAPRERKAYFQRQMLLERMSWLARASVVVSINTARANSPDGLFLDTRTESHLTGFTDALESLCGYRRPRADPFAHLSPGEKRRRRLEARSQARRVEDFY